MNHSFALPQTLVFTLAASVLAATGSRADAADVVWDGATGLFTEGTNWNTDAAPTDADTAVIDNGGTAEIVDGNDITILELRTDNGNIGQTGGTLTATLVPVTPGDNTLRGFNVGAASGGVSEYNASGTAALAGTAVRIGILAGTGTVTLTDFATYNSTNGFDTWLGQGASSVGTLNLRDNAEWNIFGNALVVGRQSGQGFLNMSGLSKLTGSANDIYFGDGGGTISTTVLEADAEITWAGTVRVGNGGSQTTVTLNDRAQLNVQNNGELWVGNGGGAVGVLTIKDSANVLVNNNWIDVGRGGGTGTLEISGQATLTKMGAGNFSVGDQPNSQGTLTVKDNATIEVVGGQFFIGNGNGAKGTVNLEGGSITVNDWVAVGRDGPGTGILNVSGGTFTKNGGGNFIMNGNANSLVNQTGGAIVVNSGQTWLSEFGDRVSNWQASGGTANLGAATQIGLNGVGTMTISGTADYTNAAVTLGVNGSATGTLNLNGGTFTASGITKGAGLATLNLNGGVVKAGADSAGYFGILEDGEINVQAGGLKFDTNSHVVVITQALAGAGGLIKQGAGTLEIANETAFTGASSVTAGTLIVSGSLAGAVSLDLATGATLGLASNVSLNDAIVLSLNAGSAVDLNFSGAEIIASLLINGVGIDVGTYTVDQLNALGGDVLFTGLDGTSALTVTTAIPEPSTIALLVASGFSVCLMARRRRD